MNWPTWDELLLKILPLKVYEGISYDIAEIYSAAVHQYPPAQEYFSQMSTPELLRFANQNAISAMNYDPYASLNDVQEFLTGLYKLIETLLIAGLTFGFLTGTVLWITYSRGLLEVLGSVSQIFFTVLLGGPATLAIPIGIVLLYIRFLSLNTFVVEVLNQALIIGPKNINTRENNKLVGYSLWNSSLNGNIGLKLLTIFSILWVLSAVIPRRDPYEFVQQLVLANIDIFVISDGVIDATKRVMVRMRTQEDDLSSTS